MVPAQAAGRRMGRAGGRRVRRADWHTCLAGPTCRQALTGPPLCCHKQYNTLYTLERPAPPRAPQRGCRRRRAWAAPAPRPPPATRQPSWPPPRMLRPKAALPAPEQPWFYAAVQQTFTAAGLVAPSQGGRVRCGSHSDRTCHRGVGLQKVQNVGFCTFAPADTWQFFCAKSPTGPPPSWRAYSRDKLFRPSNFAVYRSSWVQGCGWPPRLYPGAPHPDDSIGQCTSHREIRQGRIWIRSHLRAGRHSQTPS